MASSIAKVYVILHQQDIFGWLRADEWISQLNPWLLVYVVAVGCLAPISCLKGVESNFQAEFTFQKLHEIFSICKTLASRIRHICDSFLKCHRIGNFSKFAISLYFLKKHYCFLECLDFIPSVFGFDQALMSWFGSIHCKSASPLYYNLVLVYP